jgi:hypothetical protein
MDPGELALLQTGSDAQILEHMPLVRIGQQVPQARQRHLMGPALPLTPETIRAARIADAYAL